MSWAWPSTVPACFLLLMFNSSPNRKQNYNHECSVHTYNYPAIMISSPLTINEERCKCGTLLGQSSTYYVWHEAGNVEMSTKRTSCMSSYDVAWLQQIAPIDFWQNSTSFFGVALFCIYKIDNFRKLHQTINLTSKRWKFVFKEASCRSFKMCDIKEK